MHTLLDLRVIVMTGSLSGDGSTLNLSSISGDARGAGIIFAYEASTGRYYNSTYGYLDQLTFNSSSSAGDVTNLGFLVGTARTWELLGAMSLTAPARCCRYRTARRYAHASGTASRR
jgi:hypothetical protein